MIFNKKKLSIICLISIIGVVYAHNAYGQYFSDLSSYIRNTNLASRSLKKRNIYHTIEFLSDSLCHGRRSGSVGANEAAFQIIRSFKKMKLLPLSQNVYSQSFKLSNGEVGRNIIGIRPGSSKYDNSYIIVCANYDNHGRIDGKLLPGADCNASGVAVVIELARLFRKMSILGKYFHKGIIFIAFDAKQQNSKGAEAFWKSLVRGEFSDPINGNKITVKMIDMVVNINQIGSTLSPIHSDRKDYMIMLCGENPNLKNTMLYCNADEDLDMDLDFSYYGSKNFTNIFYKKIGDHTIFLKNGIHSVVFTSGITMNNNKSYDTVNSLDFNILKKRILLIFNWLNEYT